MSTITDVCKLAGVSKATVSRVLNNTGQVKESTKKLVYAAMKELDYRPNSIARALAKNQNMTIGFILSHFGGDYFEAILQEAADTTKKFGYQLLISGGFDNAEKEYETVQMLSDRCDALVMYTRYMSVDMLAQIKKELRIPLVLFNREAKNLFPSIMFEQKKGLFDITQYLIECGHRDIACIIGPEDMREDMQSPKKRLAGYKDALATANIPYNPELIAHGDYQMDSGYQACEDLLNKNINFTAIVACNDAMAFGALKMLHKKGISVPEQISITGVDNTPMATYVQPALTSIHQPTIEMTKKAIALAVELAKKRKLDCIDEYSFEGSLITRDSVATLMNEEKNN